MAESAVDVTKPDRYAAQRQLGFLPAPVQAIVSKPAQRAYLGAIIFTLTASTLLCVSIISYWIFYSNFVPQVGLERQVHLQFGDGHPSGTALIRSDLASSQSYDVSVALYLPRTPSNLEAGNFMLDLALFPPSDGNLDPNATLSTRKLAASRRPGILTYASPMVDTASRFSSLPFYMFGWKREAENLRIKMMERVEFSKGKNNVPGSLRLEIQSHERMQIYSAVVRFDARFTGLRWFMYNWRILSFLAFTSTFWVVSMMVASAVWMALSSQAEPETTPSESDEDRSTSIKSESEDDGSTPPSPEALERPVSHMPMRDDKDEAGIKKEEEIEESTAIEPLIKEEGEEHGKELPASSTQSQLTHGTEHIQSMQRRKAHFTE